MLKEKQQVRIIVSHSLRQQIILSHSLADYFVT